jgi:DNA polymerase III delta prime subunit
MENYIMLNSSENPVWCEKYRPKTIEDTILPESIKKTFAKYRDGGDIPNLIINGNSGIGKTSSARALLNEIDADFILINASMHGNIDTLRTEISSFASTVSFTGRRKFVILDEADFLTAATQASLRGFMEETSKNCGFILTCNIKSKIIDPLHSRCAVIDFQMPPTNSKEGAKIAQQIYKRSAGILDKEGVKYEPKVLILLVQKHYPDFRRLLNELQRASATGNIDSESLSVDSRGPIENLVRLLREKNFKEMRDWASENANISSDQVFRSLYDKAYNWVEPADIPNLVLLIGEYSYKQAFVADKEINLAAFLTQVMAEISFKKNQE